MLAYILFAIGTVLIIVALLNPEKNKEKEKFSNIEQVTREMVGNLETAANNFLQEINYKSEEIRSLLKEADNLLRKIENTKRDCLNINRKVRPANPLEEKYQRIMQLLDDGKDIVEVAKTMKMGKGEVQLILDLGKTGWKQIEAN